MTRMFKVFKAEVHTFFHSLGEHEGFRVTGDCTPSAAVEE